MQTNNVRISIESNNGAMEDIAQYVYRSMTDMCSEAADKERADVATFAKRVRLPFSGRVAAFFSWLDAARKERIERKAQAAFERGWV